MITDFLFILLTPTLNPLMARNPSKAQRARKASLLYHKVKRAVIAEAHSQGIDYKYNDKELTELVRKVYPAYKGYAARDIKSEDVRVFAENIITADETVSGQQYYNPQLIPISRLTAIDWWGIDEHLTVEIVSLIEAKNIRFQVNGGDEYGSTAIMDMFNSNGSMHYENYSSGVNDIVNAIRAAVNNSSGAEWVGEAMLRPGFPDNGQPDSYFLQYTVYIDGQQVLPSEVFEEPQVTPPPLTKEEQRKKLEQTIAKRKEIEKSRRDAQKLKDARGRRRPTAKEKTPKSKETTIKPPTKLTAKETRVANIQEALDRQERVIKDLERQVDKKLISKKDFRERSKQIIEQTTLAISKFDKGGKV